MVVANHLTPLLYTVSGANRGSELLQLIVQRLQPSQAENDYLRLVMFHHKHWLYRSFHLIEDLSIVVLQLGGGNTFGEKIHSVLYELD